MPDGDDVAALMTAEVAGPPPKSNILDVDRALVDGRRVRRHRQLLTSGAAGLAVLALAGGMAVAVASRSPMVAVPPGSQPPASQASATPRPAPTSFDPHRNLLRPGWLPEALPERVSRISTKELSLSLTHYTPISALESNPDGVLTVMLTPAGAQSRLWLQDRASAGTTNPNGQVPWPPVGVAGPSINGAASVWSAGQGLLAWQWAPGAWAVIAASGSALGRDEERRSTVVRVATTLRTDGDDPVTMPFTMSAPPAPLKLVETLVSTGSAGHYEGQLTFSDKPDVTPAAGQSYRMMVVSVMADASRGGDDKNGFPSTTVDGHPAIIDFTADYGDVQLLDVSGHRVSINVYDPVTMDYVDREKAIELAGSVRIVSGPTDRSHWTPVS